MRPELQCLEKAPHVAHDWSTLSHGWFCPGVHVKGKPKYVYVASSWRNQAYPSIIAGLQVAGIDHYDFRHPEPGNVGFSWHQVLRRISGEEASSYLRDDTPVNDYLEMIEHPIAAEGFKLDIEAMRRADTFVLVLPCGKSAHLELGWAVGQGKRTAILLEDPMQPELMYKMVDKLCRTQQELIDWLLEDR